MRIEELVQYLAQERDQFHHEIQRECSSSDLGRNNDDMPGLDGSQASDLVLHSLEQQGKCSTSVNKVSEFSNDRGHSVDGSLLHILVDILQLQSVLNHAEQIGDVSLECWSSLGMWVYACMRTE